MCVRGCERRPLRQVLPLQPTRQVEEPSQALWFYKKRQDASSTLCNRALAIVEALAAASKRNQAPTAATKKKAHRERRALPREIFFLLGFAAATAQIETSAQCHCSRQPRRRLGDYLEGCTIICSAIAGKRSAVARCFAKKNA